MASYASVKAGELSQIHRDYANSRPYYLAFFNLVQEDAPLWSRLSAGARMVARNIFRHRVRSATGILAATLGAAIAHHTVRWISQ